MGEQDDDPLWYDRVEADTETGHLIGVIAALCVGAGVVYRLPNTLYEICRAKIRLLRAIGIDRPR